MQQQQGQQLSKRQQKRLEKQQNQPKIPFEEHCKNIQNMPDMNNFKLMEKTYKIAQSVDTDFSDCVDFSIENPQKLKDHLQKYNIKKIDNLKNYPDTAYEFQHPQGVFIIKNFLSIEEQISVAQSCMNEYIHAPYRTNLFIYNEETKKWKDNASPYGQKQQDNQDKQENKQNQEQQGENKENKENQNDQISQEEQKKQEEEEQKQQEQFARDYNKDKFIINDFQKYNFDTKIRWANVGAQYDWDNRQYPSVQTPFPQKIKELSDRCQETFKNLIPNVQKYEPESTIINFYYKKSYMTGHLDDGEEEQHLPIFSFSLGQSCVFLMGDKQKDFKPIPIILEAGDLMVMSGYSRNCYHGVPRVIDGTFSKQRSKYEEYLKNLEPQIFDEKYRENNKDQKDFKNDYVHVLNFLEETRINLNFRQVLSRE